jgi:hypothetical protein
VFVYPLQNIIDELVKRRYGAVFIYPSVELKDEFVNRASSLFSESANLGDSMLAHHLHEHFEEEVIMMHDMVLHTEHTYGYMIESADYDLEDIIDEIRETTHLKNNTSKEKFIWGVAKSNMEESTSYTDNYISLVQEKATGTYYLIIDEEIIENEKVDDLSTLIDMLQQWYSKSEYYQSGNKFKLSLSDIYNDFGITSGETIHEIITKVESFLYTIYEN